MPRDEKFTVIPFRLLDGLTSKALSNYKRSLIKYQSDLYIALISIQNKFFAAYNKYIKDEKYQGDKPVSYKNFLIKVKLDSEDKKKRSVNVGAALFSRFVSALSQFQSYVSKVTTKTKARIEDIGRLTGNNKLYTLGNATKGLIEDVFSPDNYNKIPKEIREANEKLASRDKTIKRLCWPRVTSMSKLNDNIEDFIESRAKSYTNKSMSKVNAVKFNFMENLISELDLSGKPIQIDTDGPLPYKTINSIFNLALKMSLDGGKASDGYSVNRDTILSTYAEGKPSHKKLPGEKVANDPSKYSTIKDYINVLPYPAGKRKGRVYAIKNATAVIKSDIDPVNKPNISPSKYSKRSRDTIPRFSASSIRKSNDDNVKNYFLNQCLVTYFKMLEVSNIVSKDMVQVDEEEEEDE